MQHWYPFYWADYSAKTMHLTQGQHGAYFLLLRHIYSTGKPIPYKQRFSIARALLEQECENVEAVLAEFFVLKDDYYHSPRCDEVIREQAAKHQARVKAGEKGGKTKSSNARVLLQAKAKHSSSNQNQNQNNNTPIVPKGTDAGFDEFWAIYPHKVAPLRARKAYEAARKKADHAEIMIGAKAFARSTAATEKRYIPHPATWLNGGRWADDVKQSSTYPPFVPGHG